MALLQLSDTLLISIGLAASLATHAGFDTPKAPHVLIPVSHHCSFVYTPKSAQHAIYAPVCGMSPPISRSGSNR